MITYTSTDFGLILAALLICITNLVYTIMDGHTGKPQNRVYITLLLLLSVNSLSELFDIGYSAESGTSDTAFMIQRVANYVYFLCHSLLAPMLCCYVSFLIGRSVGLGFHRKPGSTTGEFLWSILPSIVVAVTEVFIALNPLTEWCWYYDDNRDFHRAWGEYIFIYALSGIWMIAAFILVMMSWNILSKGRKRSIAICFLLAGTGITVQLFAQNYRIEVLLEALSFTGALLFIENEDDRKNVEMNVYNSAAFSLDLTATLRNRIHVKTIILRGIHFDRSANTIVSGRLHREDISLAVSDYLGTVIQRYYIYSIGHGRFALTLYNYSDSDAEAIAQTITARFQQPWNINGSDFRLTSRILIISSPERAKTVEEIVYFAECPIPEKMQEPIISGSSLDCLIRRAAVEKAVTRGLAEGSFEVYYQPTYNINRTLHGAEALLRMHDKELGMIYPDEFIPIAEQLGMIDELDEFVLREVCKFILTGIPQKNGMDCINVNLSVLECMKEGFAEYVSGIVESAGVRKKMINFEITESVAARDYNQLANVIEQLKNEGFQFSIDDYGTGYSNMTSLFSLGADIIKIDKSVLWNAEKSELGMTLLRTSIEMVHEMRKKALMEGVETEAQIEILRELGCNYLQGFFFSKPLPKDEFIKLIEK